VIPRSGYRAADMLDDVAVALPGGNPSAEVRMAAVVHGYELDDERSAWPGAAIPAAPNSSENPSAEGLAHGDLDLDLAARSSPCVGIDRDRSEVREHGVVYRARTARGALACRPRRIFS
jgi:hypothetical protein